MIKLFSSKFFNERPASMQIDTLVVHSMYAPGREDPFDFSICSQTLSDNSVSAHYIIDRAGKIYQLVPDEKRAWHAGVSKLIDGALIRDNVNDFSIGIELIGDPSGFTDSQYQALAQLGASLCKKFPIRFIVGHEHVAPGRKSDPGEAFAWDKTKKLLSELCPDRARELVWPNTAPQKVFNPL